jgi:hypothetical protein
MPSPKPSQKQGVQAIERGCSILDLLGKGKQTYSISELASELDLPKPTVHRMLTTFCRFGYVIQDEISKEYRLGFQLVELGQNLACTGWPLEYKRLFIWQSSTSMKLSIWKKLRGWMIQRG